MTVTSSPPGARTVVGNISLSLDGRVTGPGGEYDMSWVAARSSWSLSGMTRTESGALCLVYDRVRAATVTPAAG